MKNMVFMSVSIQEPYNIVGLRVDECMFFKYEKLNYLFVGVHLASIMRGKLKKKI